jgi:hypothetical protein
VGPRAGLDVCEKSHPHRDSFYYHSKSKLQSSHTCYTASTSLYRRHSPKLGCNPWVHILDESWALDNGFLAINQSLSAALVALEKLRYLHRSASVAYEMSSVSRTLR